MAESLRRVLLAAALPLLMGAGPVEVTIHLAEEQGEPVAHERWLANQFTLANEILEGTEVRVERGALRLLKEPAPDVMTVRDRHALAAGAERDGTIHVFVVRKLADKDKEGAFINGVHWRYRGKRKKLRGRRYVILSASAYPDTLAHELGHFFGLKHSEKPDNLMSYAREGGELFLTERQVRRVNRRLKRARRAGLLAPGK